MTNGSTYEGRVSQLFPIHFYLHKLRKVLQIPIAINDRSYQGPRKDLLLSASQLPNAINDLVAAEDCLFAQFNFIYDLLEYEWYNWEAPMWSLDGA